LKTILKSDKMIVFLNKKEIDKITFSDKENLEEYFKVEFGDKRQEDISFEDITRIPFWSDIM